LFDASGNVLTFGADGKYYYKDGKPAPLDTNHRPMVFDSDERHHQLVLMEINHICMMTLKEIL